MKKLLFILALCLSVFASAQCPSGNLVQNAKWKFTFSQCFGDTNTYTYVNANTVAYFDANKNLVYITFAQLADSLGVESIDSFVYATHRWVDSSIAANNIFITPQQYGAVADSVTDDYQAFQDAVDAQSEDVFIYVPAGYYRITDNIVISGKRRVKIWGEGVILMQHDTGAAIFITGGDTGDIEISGLKFDFQGRRVNNMAVNIYYRAPEKMIIQNCEFLNFGDTATVGIRLERVPTAIRYYGQTTISNCLFMNVQDATYPYDSTKKGRGIMLTGTNVGVNGSEYGNITGCTFSSIGVAVYWENGSANWNFVNNNVLFCNSNLGSDRYAKGILHVATGNSGNKGKINIYGNKFNHNFSISIFSGYQTSQYRPIIIDGNEFLSNGAMPIYLQNYGHVITNNIFDRMAETPGSATGTNPWASDTAKSYILLDSTLYARVSGNFFYGLGDNPAKYALKTTNSDYTYFQDNIFTPGALGVNIPDAVSYLDTTNAGTRYISDPLNVTGNITTSAFLFANDAVLTGSITVGATERFRWNGRGRMFAPSNGNYLFTNDGVTDFGRLMLGGQTSSFPAIKRSGTGLQIRLADDSDFAPLEAGATNINTVLTLNPISATTASALTPTLGMLVVVNTTNGTFTSTGLWFYNGAAWVFIA